MKRWRKQKICINDDEAAITSLYLKILNKSRTVKPVINSKSESNSPTSPSTNILLVL